jgi:DNA-directed RNA polymerase III subunit RPC6
MHTAQYPTRKMFFLEHIIPSIEVTGGPWYSGAELDLEFIEGMKKLVLKLIKTAVRLRI